MNYRFAHAKRGHRSTLVSILGAAASTVALVAGLAAVPAASAGAVAVASHATAASPCNVSVSGGGEVVDGMILGAVAGSTKVTMDCDYSSTTGPSIGVEASLLATIGNTSVLEQNEVDTSNIVDFPTSPTASDTGCPAGSSCVSTTITLPSTYAAGDKQSQCPPSQAQINAGIFGCAIVAASSTDQIVADYLLQYATQSTAPNAPTISALQSKGSVGSNIDVSDAANATGYWWGDAVQEIQALSGLSSVIAPPATCSSTSYGTVPTTTLNVLWFASGSTTPLEDSASNVSISNDCYNGVDVTPPSLSGTIPVPPTAVAGTTYEVFLCELNVTPYVSGDNPDCGTAPTGQGFIGASFPFTVASGVISQNLPVSGSATSATSAKFTTQLVTSGNAGAVTFTQSAGSPSVVVSSSGAVTTSGALKAGTYTASGTTKDASGNTGTFTFSLTVLASPPKATSVSGTAVPGKTVTLTIHGSNFAGKPHVTGNAGARVSLLKVTASTVEVKVTEPASAKKGNYTITLSFSSGKTSARFSVK